MKASIHKPIHNCNTITDWTSGSTSSVVIDTTEKVEGSGSIKFTSDPAIGSLISYAKSVDLSSSSHLYFYVYHPGATTETGQVRLWEDDANFSIWNFTWTNTWTQIKIDLSSEPDSSAGDLDLSNINHLRIQETNVEDPGESYYVDFVYGYKDIEENLSKCFVHSPIYKKRYSICNAEFSPTDKSYFVKGDVLHIQDPNSVSSFYGRIADIDQPRPSLYTLTALSDGFEFMNKSSMISDTSATTTSFLKQAISDSSLSVEGSLQTTTVVYDYALGKSNKYLVDHSRYLEYGSFYREPTYDGACYFNKEVSDVVSLIDTGEVWTELGSFNVMLIDHRSYDLGITRVHVWSTINSKEQVNVIASKSTPEQETGIFPTYHYSDYALKNYTEVNQMATKLLTIFGKETDFYELLVQNRGFKQWEKRVNFKWNIDGILTTADDFRIVEWIYDAKFDRYPKFIISNNIAFEEEFKNIKKQLERDDVLNAEYIDITQPVSTADGTVIPGARHDKFVWRVPEPTGWDFQEGGGSTDFSTIGDVGNTWYDLDLSSIVPVGTTYIKFRIMIQDDVGGSQFGLRKNGQVSTIQKFNIRTDDANDFLDGGGDVGIDSDRKVEFFCNPKASDFSLIQFVVVGYGI